MRRMSTQDPTRRNFIATTTAATAGLALSGPAAFAQGADRDAVLAQIKTQHDQTVRLLREWIALPSIAAENTGFPQGPEHMAKLAREAGFTKVEVIPTKGKSGVFATLDNGAPTTLAVYFMYDVKQYDPAEWSSPHSKAASSIGPASAR